MKSKSQIIEELNELYKKTPFSIGLHTTNLESSRKILKEGLKSGARKIEGTIKLKGDLSQVSIKDLDYFFPYTDHTVVVAIPIELNAPRIEDNMGGDKCLCEFSEFFENAQRCLPHYSFDEVSGLLPNYYIVGYYDKNFKMRYNPKCLLFDKKSKERFERDVESCHVSFMLEE